MISRLKILTWFISLTASLLASSHAVSADEALNVIVSIVPQKYFVEKIGGDLVEVSAMVLPGFSPAVYEPKPQQMVGLTKARIYFAVGVPFEKAWLKKFVNVNPKMMVVHTDDGIEKIPMKSGHRHDKEDHHGGKDPHIWLSPPLVMIQARNILDALMRVDPENKDIYKTNYRAFIRELVDLDLHIKEIFSGKREGGQFMVYHPSWGYFAESYGLEQIPIEIEGKEPTARELQDFVLHAGEAGVTVIFVQPQLSEKSAHTIAKAVGCRVESADPLAENWSENLLNVADKFRSAQK